MCQLLPELRDILNEFSDGIKRFDKEPPENREWDDLDTSIREVDEKADRIKDNLVSNSPDFLKEAVRDACYLKKNNDRTFSAYTGVVLGGADPDKFFDILFALDVLDLSVLVIDDILDGAEKRANKPAHHLKWGMETSLSIAMYLKSVSSKMVIESFVDEKRRLKILKEMDELHLKIYEGQFLDADFRNKDAGEITEDAYLDMVSLTTGYQIAGCFRIGGILAGLDEDTITILGEIGLRFGTAGQIRDDMIDYMWDENSTWKTPLLDFKTDKKRIPLIIAWKNATEEERDELAALQKMSNLETRDYMQVLSIVMKPKNLNEIRLMIRSLEREAMALAKKTRFSSEGMGLLKMLFSLIRGN